MTRGVLFVAGLAVEPGEPGRVAAGLAELAQLPRCPDLQVVALLLRA